MSINKELSHREFMQSEYNSLHSPYEKELEFYASVRVGNLEAVKRLYTPLAVSGYGKLSEDKIRNIKYHLVISIAMIARFCIEGGMATETAYTISDIYINRLDECTTEKQLTDIHLEMIIEYTKRMKKIASGEAYSKNVLMCLDYIFDNIYKGVKVCDIAKELKLSPQYLSKLFHKEVGVKISDYIMQKRIQASENMLKFSDYTPVDISNYLNFCSHSHFINAFKKQTGLTPKQYQEKYFRINWKDKSD